MDQHLSQQLLELKNGCLPYYEVHNKICSFFWLNSHAKNHDGSNTKYEGFSSAPLIQAFELRTTWLSLLPKGNALHMDSTSASTIMHVLPSHPFHSVSPVSVLQVSSVEEPRTINNGRNEKHPFCESHLPTGDKKLFSIHWPTENPGCLVLANCRLTQHFSTPETYHPLLP